MKIDLHPKTCNLCSSEVVFTSNKVIYGREYGSGKCYICTNPKCRAYVGTHKPRPDEAFGILADEDMRTLKMKCHDLFDEKWQNEPTSRERHFARKKAYKELAEVLEIAEKDCHFGYFDRPMLIKALDYLKKEQAEKLNIISSNSNVTVYTADDEEADCMRCENVCASYGYCSGNCGPSHLWSGYRRLEIIPQKKECK